MLGEPNANAEASISLASSPKGASIAKSKYADVRMVGARGRTLDIAPDAGSVPASTAVNRSASG